MIFHHQATTQIFVRRQFFPWELESLSICFWGLYLMVSKMDSYFSVMQHCSRQTNQLSLANG